MRTMSKDMTMQSLKVLSSMVSKTKPTNVVVVFFPQNEEIHPLSPLNTYESKKPKKWYFYILLAVLNNPTKYQFNVIRT